MASKIPQKTLANIIAAWIAGADVRARLVMSDTTCDTQIDGINTLSDYTDIDPADAGGYADVAVTGEAANADDGNNRAEYDANNVVFTGLGGDATRDYVGVLLYDYVNGTDAQDKSPIFIEFSAPIPKEVTALTVPWNDEGIVQYTPA